MFVKQPSCDFKEIVRVLNQKLGVVSTYANLVDFEALESGEANNDRDEKEQQQAELARLTTLYVAAVKQQKDARLALDLMAKQMSSH